MSDKLFLRRGEVRDMLGISEQVMTKLVQAKTLTPRYLVDGGQAYYLRTEVLKLAKNEQSTANNQHPKTNNESKQL